MFSRQRRERVNANAAPGGLVAVMGFCLMAAFLGTKCWRLYERARGGFGDSSKSIESQIVSTYSADELDTYLPRYYDSQSWKKGTMSVSRGESNDPEAGAPGKPLPLLLTLYEAGELKGKTVAAFSPAVCDLLKLLARCKNGTWNRVQIDITADVEDRYGRQSRSTVLHGVWDRSEVDKINWERFQQQNIFQIAREFHVGTKS
jgi:hypothetical protein